jgi:hypothetical protein
MNTNEVLVCQKILEHLANIPIAQFFWDTSADLTNPCVVHPFSLGWICTRFEQGKYTSSSDMIRDIRICLQNGRNGTAPASMRFAAATQLSSELDSLILSLHPSAFPSVLPLSLAISEFEDPANRPPPISPHEHPERPPGSELFKQAADPHDLARLIRDIRLLFSADLTAKLAVLVRRIQPEGVTIGDDISFNIGLMTDATRRALRNCVDKMLLDAATGRIDPFARPVGERVSTIRIKERGVLLVTGRALLQ